MIRLARLELLLPPPVVFSISILFIWLLNDFFPLGYNLTFVSLLLCILFFAAAGVIGVLSLAAFIRAKTTANPLRVSTASTLVETGLYAHSRNPMYLALALLLVSLSLYLVNPLSIFGLLLFIGFITRFQIIPEERALNKIFADRYSAYCRRVRRWI